jgi:hypothetical protein
VLFHVRDLARGSKPRRRAESSIMIDHDQERRGTSEALIMAGRALL